MSVLFWKEEAVVRSSRWSILVAALCLYASVGFAELGVQDFRGSTLSVSSAVSYGTINREVNQTYNPFFNTTLSLAPRYWISPQLFVAGQVSFDREWTDRDDGTYRDETRVSDTTLRVGALLHRWDFGMLTFAGAGVRLPTSPLSQASTLNASYNGVVGVIQSLGSWGSANYFFSAAFNHFRYTTGETETPRIQSCAGDPSGCGSFLNTGVRNGKWVTSHILNLNIFPTGWLFISAGATFIQSHLFPRGVDDSTISYQAQEPTNSRYLVSYNAEVDFQPSSWLVIALMANTFNQQLAPNSTYYRPFFNRNTSFMVDFRFTLGVFRVAQSDSGDGDKKKKKKKKS